VREPKLVVNATATAVAAAEVVAEQRWRANGTKYLRTTMQGNKCH